jgi:hypothetical protein
VGWGVGWADFSASGFVGPWCHARAMPRTTRLDGLDELLDKQLAVASREQLLGLGMSKKMIQWRLREDGPWQVLLPGVYLGTSGPPSMRQKEIAALIYAGPRSVITGPVALMHYSIRSVPDLTMIDVLVPVGRQRLNAGFARLHRTSRWPTSVNMSGPVRLAPVPRAVADTAWQLGNLRDVRAVVADVVQLGRCTVGQLAEELNAGPSRGSATFRSVLAEVTEGVRSVAEADLRDLIRKARLPTPLFNPSLFDDETFLAKPDAWWPKAGVAAEVDSREWHLSPEDWQRTMDRHDRMGAAGIIVLHFSPRDIRSEPVKVARRIKDALEHGLQRPALTIRTIPCAA